MYSKVFASFVSMDSSRPVAFPALVVSLFFAVVLIVALAFSGRTNAAEPASSTTPHALLMGLSDGPNDKEGPRARDQLTLSVWSRASGRLAVYEGCKDYGHYVSMDRSQPAGYWYYTCNTYAFASGFTHNWDIAPETMAISMFIDGETRDECAMVNEGYHASYNNRFITYSCR